MIVLLRTSLKSLQLVLNEMAEKRNGEVVTAGALTQARAHLRYTAFIELNQQAVVEVMYRDDDIKRYQGMRVLAMAGSKILLPRHPRVVEEFGEISYSNDHPEVHGTHAYALASAMDEVLNGVAIDSVLGQARDYEVDLAIAHHLPPTRANDRLIVDRHDPSYGLIALRVSAERPLVMRGSASSFATARQMLQGQGAHDQTVTLTPHHTQVESVCFHDLPEAVKVRFVRVMLNTGEYEVLLTNWLDTSTFPTEEFQAIYHRRWGGEGFYNRLKSRLHLENFTGKTAEAVYQHFYAAVYLTGLETLLTWDVNQSFAAKPTPAPQPVNHAVAFHAIKNQAFELLASDWDSQTLIERLELLFTKTPTLKRIERSVPRKKTSYRRRLNHIKRKQKICF